MLPQLSCLTAACTKLGLLYTFFDDNHNALAVTVHDKPLFFANCTTPYNLESQAEIAEDKYFTYKLCHEVVRMPETRAYIDPFVPAAYTSYVTHTSYAAIAADIAEHFQFPIVVKRNRGSRGDNVFLCHSTAEILRALRSIFNHRAKNYDYVALAETYISIAREFRVVTFARTIILLYEKEITEATYAGNLSPLHWQNAKAVIIEDEQLRGKVDEFLQPFFAKLPLTFAGFDVVIDSSGRLSLIEVNTRPGFDYFIRDNGEESIVDLYQKILAHF